MIHQTSGSRNKDVDSFTESEERESQWNTIFTTFSRTHRASSRTDTTFSKNILTLIWRWNHPALHSLILLQSPGKSRTSRTSSKTQISSWMFKISATFSRTLRATCCIWDRKGGSEEVHVPGLLCFPLLSSHQNTWDDPGERLQRERQTGHLRTVWAALGNNQLEDDQWSYVTLRSFWKVWKVCWASWRTGGESLNQV